MKIVLAPDSFKESMTAKEACDAMERGIKRVFPEAECIKVPMADGGEGTVQSLIDATDGELVEVSTIAPLGNEIKASFGLLGGGQGAVIEMAAASGLHLVPLEKRNPLITTSYGTGVLIKEALNRGVKNILIGIGGSATNDGGAGMLQALGIKLLDEAGMELPFGGGALDRLKRIDIQGLDKRILETNIQVACDVTNPLIGKNGASAVFGPQKGATVEMVEILDKNLTHFAEVIKQELGIDIAQVPGGGAAGGLGASLKAILKAELKSGVELVVEYTSLVEKVKGASYVFTGEGSIDSQTINGKTPFGVAQVSKKQGVPVIAFAGRVGQGSEVLYNHGINSIIGILPEALELNKALIDGKENLERAAESIMRILSISKTE
ncbi:glycerate kinase [Alloiococcus sp. CFN-8]|uniref:glycerate kinase n=1 Tax=Alloiococcus sp. CFN-8 TaxID=3416081 RepID=UPI003CF20E82